MGYLNKNYVRKITTSISKITKYRLDKNVSLFILIQPIFISLKHRLRNKEVISDFRFDTYAK